MTHDILVDVMTMQRMERSQSSIDQLSFLTVDQSDIQMNADKRKLELQMNSGHSLTIPDMA